MVKEEYKIKKLKSPDKLGQKVYGLFKSVDGDEWKMVYNSTKKSCKMFLRYIQNENNYKKFNEERELYGI